MRQHDKRLDSTAQALAWIRQGEVTPEPGIIGYDRQLAETMSSVDQRCAY